ncbi:MAG: Heterodimeric efflux ABC transporter, permease/ATP-binding subunit 1 [Ktedonobacterales bacterium]|nr:MAG: Heterodimeric efflux ABC transporter, permease/ATP-binding subunit 1 [Ktedonobacterales bacterium]
MSEAEWPQAIQARFQPPARIHPERSGPVAKSEFTITGARTYNRAGPIRWILSHILRYKLILLIFIGGTILSQVLIALVASLTGAAFNAVLGQSGADRIGHLLPIALLMLGVTLAQLFVGGAGAFGSEFLAQRLERDARDELYQSLLGKSQTFHNRQRVGDVMARAANDVRQLNPMINPGVSLILDSFMSLIVPMIFIAFINLQLLAAPVFFTVAFLFALRRYTRQLNPVNANMRMQFGAMNAGLAETITGIELVKSTAQEAQEKRKFARNATAYRDYFVQNGGIQAVYLPPLLIGIALVAALLHGLFLVTHGQLTIGGLVAYLGLMTLLRYPSFISIFTFNLVQLGIAGANRILSLMREETELDENTSGYAERIKGDIVFDDVSFGYGGAPVLKHISFRAAPGQTVAIVGQTGSGKSTLTKLVNRTYDVTEGRILLDGVDLRDWSLNALRSQISTIEQDIFLFSRTIAENIAFSLGQQADPAAIETAAKEAQAHEFITHFADGYDTIVGERGVTLSGGQRQRLAIARALLTDPRILMLDDSTSAIDSATEDEIQRAIRRVLEGRTTLLITHRLSQIRWADKILVLKQGELIDQGTHEELLARCDLYRRIFAHYDTALPTPSTDPATSATDIPVRSN